MVVKVAERVAERVLVRLVAKVERVAAWVVQEVMADMAARAELEGMRRRHPGSGRNCVFPIQLSCNWRAYFRCLRNSRRRAI